MATPPETQYESAQRMYTARAAEYDNSWHPGYTERFMALVDVSPGDRVLILACGTGLEAEVAAPKFGDEGLIAGVDATPRMLDEARKKQAADPVLTKRLCLYQHDVTNLDVCDGVEPGYFEWILCSNAFVLFDNPAGVVEHWRQYLKLGGRMVIDITHEYNLRQGLLMERVAKRLGLDYPANRAWIESKESFRGVLEEKGLVVERIELLEKEIGKGSQFIDVSRAEEQFDFITKSPLTKMFTSDKLRARALPIF